MRFPHMDNTYTIVYEQCRKNEEMREKVNCPTENYRIYKESSSLIINTIIIYTFIL